MPLVLSGTDGLSGVDGTASNPAIEGTDSNTGIFYPAADTVAIGTGGTEALRVNSSQSLLLNTTSAPAASAKMKIATSSRTGAFFDLTATGGENWIIDSTNTTGSTDVFGIYANGATGLYIQDTGNVGVGTSSPGKKLDVSGDIRTSSTFIVTSNGTGSITDGANTYVGLSSSQLTLRTDTAIPIVALTNGTERARITSGGDFLVGNTNSTPAQSNVSGFSYRSGIQLEIGAVNTQAALFGRSNDGQIIRFYNGGAVAGNISNTGTTTSYNGTSDYRLKENIQPMTGALAKVAALKPCTYTWKADGRAGQGFIAHELQEVIPDAVQGEKDQVNEDGTPEYQGIDPRMIVATLTAAIQELNAKVEAQAAEIAALKGNA